MVDQTSISKRNFLGMLLGGGALLLGFEDAEAAQSQKHKHKRRRRHAPKHKPHAKPHHAPHAASHPSRPHPQHAGAPANAHAEVGQTGVDSGAARGAGGSGGGGSGGGGGGGAGGGGAGGAGGGGAGGGGAGGGGGGGWSDRRLKRDIVRLGVSPSGLPIYGFQYVWGGPRFVGVMAQDLLQLRPDAVTKDESGFYWVDYARIDVDMREETNSPVDFASAP